MSTDIKNNILIWNTDFKLLKKNGTFVYNKFVGSIYSRLLDRDSSRLIYFLTEWFFDENFYMESEVTLLLSFTLFTQAFHMANASRNFDFSMSQKLKQHNI